MCRGGLGGGADAEQPGRHAGDPTFSRHSEMKLAQSTPLQHLAEFGRIVIVSVTVQA